MLAQLPRGPVALDEAWRLYPAVRQSLLSKFDDCALSTMFEIKLANGWNTHPQARGTIFHRFAAEALREMQRNQSRTIPVQLAEQILVFVCRQHDVPLSDIVRVPLRQMPELRMAARKFAKDNEFSVERIVDIEKRLSADLTYPHPDGGLVTRTLTGQIDALLFAPPSGAIVIDWKDTWALPPEPKERDPQEYVGADDELRGLSYHGYFQQRFYGWLVMKNYANVDSVTLREFYARRTKARKATLTRDRMHEVEEELSILVEAFDLAVVQGEPSWPIGWFDAVNPATGEIIEVDGVRQRVLDIERLGRWTPQPGKHCGFCVGSRHCPIDADVRIEVGGAITSWEMAKRAAAELNLLEEVKKKLVEACKGFVETQGSPIPVKASKGRRMLGWYSNKGGGRRFGLYTPDESDRGGHADLDAQLEAAMREATTRAKAEKPKRRRRVGKV